MTILNTKTFRTGRFLSEDPGNGALMGLDSGNVVRPILSWDPVTHGAYIGTTVAVSNALLAAVPFGTGGNCYEFGHANPAGYRGVLGAESTSGRNFLALHGEAGTTANTYRTRGVVGTVLLADAAGGLYVASALTANADNQALATIAHFGYSVDSSPQLTIGASSFRTAGEPQAINASASTGDNAHTRIGIGATQTRTVDCFVGFTIGIEGVAIVSHVANTTGTVIGVHGVAEILGSGGTTLNACGFRASGNVNAGAIVTSYYGMLVVQPANAGTITTLYGLYVTDLTLGATNIPLELVNAMRVDKNATAGESRLLIWDVTGAALARVKIGAAGTGPGGAGKALYI